MRTVADFGLENIRALRGEKNWRASLSNLQKISQRQKQLGPTSEPVDAEPALVRMCEAGTKRFQDEQRRADQWWHIWLNEVEALKRKVERFDETWRYAAELHDSRRPEFRLSGQTAEFVFAALNVSMACSSQSRLVEVMVGAGVRLKEATSVPSGSLTGLTGLAPLVVAALTSGLDPRDLHDQFMQLVHLAEQWIRNDSERRIQPQVEITLNMLKAKYGTTNPFAEYTFGKSCATPELRLLVKEHKLPDGNRSPWLKAWETTLEEPLDWNGFRLLTLPPDLEDENLEPVVRAVDSTLKAHVTDNCPQLVSWDAFLQGLYELHCVRELGRGAGGANKKAGKTFSIWSVDEFVRYIRAVTAKVNELGYRLTCPPDARLIVLLEKTTKGDSLYGEDSW
jgi:hypothetical protein